jgi:hypothetical protein
VSVAVFLEFHLCCIVVLASLSMYPNHRGRIVVLNENVSEIQIVVPFFRLRVKDLFPKLLCDRGSG